MIEANEYNCARFTTEGSICRVLSDSNIVTSIRGVELRKGEKQTFDSFS